LFLFSSSLRHSSRSIQPEQFEGVAIFQPIGYSVLSLHTSLLARNPSNKQKILSGRGKIVWPLECIHRQVPVRIKKKCALGSLADFVGTNRLASMVIPRTADMARS